MAILNIRVKASTIIEVIMAMVIILISLGIGMTIFSNISRDVNDELRILAEIQANTLIVETKLKKDYTDAIFEFENMTINRSILSYPTKIRVKVLFLEIFSLKGKKIADYREIITMEELKE